MASVSRSDVLTLALLLSLGLNFYEILKDSGMMYCDDSNRYSERELSGGGREFATNESAQLIREYQDAHATDQTIYKTTGWNISKRAIDNIFNNADVSSLSLNLVQANDSLKIIAKGVRTDKTAIDCEIHNSIFIVQSMCPNDCFQ